jgi:CheY-like chemotaxis protein
MRVLIVDDEPDVRDFLASVLEDAGFQVSTARDGNEALEQLRLGAPDLISTDLVMPGKSGIRLIHELRKNPTWARIPVLVVTGHAGDRDIGAGLDGILAESSTIGRASCLEKPITPRGYLESVCRLLDVELPVVTAPDGDEIELRRQAESMLRGADRATLEAVLAHLRESGPGSRGGTGSGDRGRGRGSGGGGDGDGDTGAP